MKAEAKIVLDIIKKKSKNTANELGKDEEIREAEREEMFTHTQNLMERRALEKDFKIERERVNKYQRGYEKS